MRTCRRIWEGPSSAARRGRPTSSIPRVGPDNSSRSSPRTGPVRSRAAAIRASSTTGSLSPWPSCTHLLGLGSRSAHCATSVDFPWPAGARTSTTRLRPAAFRHDSRRARGTTRGRTVGTRRLDSRNSGLTPERTALLSTLNSTPRRVPCPHGCEADLPLASPERRNADWAMPAHAPVARRLVLSSLDDERARIRCPAHRRAGLRQHLGHSQGRLLGQPDSHFVTLSKPVGRIRRCHFSVPGPRTTSTVSGADVRGIRESYVQLSGGTPVDGWAAALPAPFRSARAGVTRGNALKALFVGDCRWSERRFGRGGFVRRYRPNVAYPPVAISSGSDVRP